MFELDPAKSLSAPGLVWLGASKKTKAKSDLLLLMVEKEEEKEEEHVTLFINMQKVIVNTKDYNYKHERL